MAHKGKGNTMGDPLRQHSTMVVEDLSAPGNMPQNVIRKMYGGSNTGENFHYDGFDSAMEEQQMADIRMSNKTRAKRRY